MAKKKRSKGRSYRKKGARRSGSRMAKPAGVAGGLAASGMKMATTTVDQAASALDQLIIYKRPGDAIKVFILAAKKAENYYPAAIGLGVSASKGVPGIRVVAKPVDRAIRAFTKGKWGL